MTIERGGFSDEIIYAQSHIESSRDTRQNAAAAAATVGSHA